MPAVEDVVRAFVDAYSAGDHARTRDLVDDAIEAHMTSPAGGVDHVVFSRSCASRPVAAAPSSTTSGASSCASREAG